MSIFDSFLSTPAMRTVFDGPAVIGAMLRFEAGLAHAQADVGLVPAQAADAIADCCRLAEFDPVQIGLDSGRAGSLAIPLVKALKDIVGQRHPDALPHVHLGATSQDVIDTAMVLVTRDALALLLADVDAAIAALLRHAGQHAATPMLARTLMQPASVTSFGLVCAGWAAPLVRSRERLQVAAQAALQLQLGGAVGTLAQMKGQGAEVRARLAAALQLRDPGATWHTQRDSWTALGCELGLLAGSLGKIALDISLLGQYEVAEVTEPAEPGRGGSSAMPHKRNPVASMVALAAAQRAPQHVAAMLSAMPQQHQRALGPWQAELAEWPQLWLTVQGSAHALAGALPGLNVDAVRMRANIDRLRAELPAQAADEWFDPAFAQVAAALARRQAQDLQTRFDGVRNAVSSTKDGSP
ncbi:lyase family protein [Variovorax guangxiensis]|uniref:3-carboxy-cis,cis-muconate cycloisomerase n=1 Tax=Variovorax guangxiensis TaxID=1775474 RepID=A0A502E2A1_9BURK|nr:lyase family protein [Variovorax guangxiensis]TPG27357.1 3-carboxy-cis,cis-muconate cycloisomerase [Variovorax ginsengisoli]TPG31079.1 3-carboxy-cis,cis-muconate cycloisomerase [Variovorax guangxiensis]